MSDSSRRCMLLAEIGNECMREEHITEIEQRTTLTEMIEWVKSRDDHLEEKLRGRWGFARIYLFGNEDTLSANDRQHVLTIYAVRNRRDGDRYETIFERYISLRAARNP
jgi:hypothetical protein